MVDWGDPLYLKFWVKLARGYSECTRCTIRAIIPSNFAQLVGFRSYYYRHGA